MSTIHEFDVTQPMHDLDEFDVTQPMHDLDEFDVTQPMHDLDELEPRTNMNYIPYELIVEILQYIKPLDIGSFNSVDINYLCNLFNYGDLRERCHRVTQLATVNKYYHEMIQKYGHDVMFFTGDISIDVLKKYTPQYIVAPKDTVLNDMHMKLLKECYQQKGRDLKFLKLDLNIELSDSGILQFSGILYLLLGGYNIKITNNSIRHLSKLKYLKLNNDFITNEAIDMLPDLVHLEYIRPSLKIFPKPDEKLINIPKLETLIVVDNIYVDDASLASVPQLRHLEMVKSTITDIGLKHLSNLQYFKIWNRYRPLNIIMPFTDIGLSYVPKLTHLTLYTLCNNITNKGLSYIPHLIYLHINNTTIDDDGLVYVSKLRVLIIENNTKFTNVGLGYVSNLTNIELNSNITITNDGLKHTPKLEYICMKENPHITYDCGTFLSNIKHIKTKHLKAHIISS